MNTNAFDLRQTGVLLRGEAEPISRWVREWNPGRVVTYLAIIIAGSAAYGAAMGIWRAPLQCVFTAAKFPLLILLTTFGNALLNGMLAPLLGLNIGFRASLLAILVSFTIGAVILGAFSPLILFLVWNTPPNSTSASASYHFMKLTQVCVIAFAGVAANVRLLGLLKTLSGNQFIARKVLLGWLAGNLLLGGQLSWILRPFVGSPDLPVEFLRRTAFQGNFFESVFEALRTLFFS